MLRTLSRSKRAESWTERERERDACCIFRLARQIRHSATKRVEKPENKSPPVEESGSDATVRPRQEVARRGYEAGSSNQRFSAQQICLRLTRARISGRSRVAGRRVAPVIRELKRMERHVMPGTPRAHISRRFPRGCDEMTSLAPLRRRDRGHGDRGNTRNHFVPRRVRINQGSVCAKPAAITRSIDISLSTHYIIYIYTHAPESDIKISRPGLECTTLLFQ